MCVERERGEDMWRGGGHVKAGVWGWGGGHCTAPESRLSEVWEDFREASCSRWNSGSCGIVQLGRKETHRVQKTKVQVAKRLATLLLHLVYINICIEKKKSILFCLVCVRQRCRANWLFVSSLVSRYHSCGQQLVGIEIVINKLLTNRKTKISHNAILAIC